MQPLAQLGIQDVSQFFQKFTQNPAYQFVLKLLENDRFLKGMDGLVQFKDWKGLLMAQIAVFVFLIFFRSWRMSMHKQGSFFPRIWTGLWTSVLGWTLMMFVVPYVMIGQPYLDAILGSIEVIRSQPTE